MFFLCVLVATGEEGLMAVVVGSWTTALPAELVELLPTVGEPVSDLLFLASKKRCSIKVKF